MHCLQVSLAPSQIMASTGLDSRMPSPRFSGLAVESGAAGRFVLGPVPDPLACDFCAGLFRMSVSPGAKQHNQVTRQRGTLRIGSLSRDWLPMVCTFQDAGSRNWQRPSSLMPLEIY